MHPSSTSGTQAQDYQVLWPMFGHRGRSPTTIGIKVTRSYTWCLKSYTSGVHKNARFKCQPSTPMQPFVSRDAHLLWKLMTKEERLYKDMKYARGIREKLDLDMDMDKEGATLRNWEGSKFLDKRSTQVGGASLWTFGWLHLIRAKSCACLHCISFKFDMHVCVVYASCRI